MSDGKVAPISHSAGPLKGRGTLDEIIDIRTIRPANPAFPLSFINMRENLKVFRECVLYNMDRAHKIPNQPNAGMPARHKHDSLFLS